MIRKFELDLGSIFFNPESTCIESILFGNKDELIERNIPFFLIKMRREDGSSYFIPGDTFSYVKSENYLHYYSNNDVDVILKLEVKDDALYSRINVKNKTNLLIEQVELLSFGLYPKLKEEIGGRGEIYIPYNEGAVVKDLQRRLKSPFPYYDVDYPSLGKYFVFPNMISSQFITYFNNGQGIYLGMHDTSRTTKHIDFNLVNDALKLQLRTFTNLNYGDDYEMNFDSVIKLFESSPYRGFDIYRDWFYQNKPNNLLTIKNNKKLPKWYKESPLVVTYPIRGTSDGDNEMEPNGMYPYKNALPHLLDIKNKTNSKILDLLMHYEGTAPWAPPYYWPPYGGLEQFNEYVDLLHQNDILIGLYTSGFGYTVESYRADYNQKEEFESQNLKTIMCSNTNGEIRSTIVNNIRLGYDLCPSCDKTKEIIKTETEKIIESKIDYLQVLDQNHGGSSYFCYSKEHNHPATPGAWQVNETINCLTSINKKNVIFGCESAASEPFIPYILFSDNRYILNYYIGEPFPIYSYLYHEFVNNFMGNQICATLENKPFSYLLRMAYSFTCGDMFTIVLNGDGNVMDAWCNPTVINKENVLKFVKTLNEWRRDRYKFLCEGKMTDPIKFNTNKLSITHEDGHVFKFDAILTSSFTDGVDTEHYLVNYDLNPHTVYFNEPTKVYLDSKAKKFVISKKVEIPPMTVYMVRSSKRNEKATYLDNHSENQKSFNEIFYMIVNKTKTTRREIQRTTGYSWGTVSSVVALLLDKKLIVETDSVSNGVGRATSYLIPNGNKFVSIGIDFNSTGFNALVMGIDSSILKSFFFKYDGDTYEYAFDLLCTAIDKCIEFSNNDYEIFSIGISCQGNITKDGLYENFGFAKGWKNIDLVNLIKNKYGIYTYIQHDVFCLLESYIAKNDDHPDSFLISRLVSGDGFSLYFNDQMVSNLTLDFGHMLYVMSGEAEKTLEDFATTGAICKAANVSDFEKINSNREMYRKILDNTSRVIGIAFANISRFFPIKKIIMTGCVINNDTKMIDTINDVFKHYKGIREFDCSVEYIDDLSASFGAARLSILDKIMFKNNQN